MICLIRRAFQRSAWGGEYLFRQMRLTAGLQSRQPYKEGGTLLLFGSTLKWECGFDRPLPALNIRGEKRFPLEPVDYTDVGEAAIFAHEYGDSLRYSPQTGWLAWDGMRWREDDLAAQGLAQELTARQIEEAKRVALDARARLLEAQVAAGQSLDDKEAKALEEHSERYLKFAIQRRKTAGISAALNEARPALKIDIETLDADPFVLNTPGGIVDLRTGEIRPHDPGAFCTKISGCAPGSEGAALFDGFLDRITGGDVQLRDYLQFLAGMFSVGAVFRENLIIAFGSGGNGKSTFFNLLGRVLGDYTGSLSSEILTSSCRKNPGPELAELRGRRLVIAAELEEGMRLDTAAVKKLSSTDAVCAEQKYRTPFSFRPSHSLVLFTNHLPKVGTSDSGTWSRLVVVPFMASIRGTSDEVMNFTDYLFDHAGGAVLSWMIEGARRFIDAGYKIDAPDCVRGAIGEYCAENDWLAHFLSEKCEIDETFSQPSGELYKVYRDYCAQSGEYTRSSVDFRRALEGAGYSYRKKKSGIWAYGLRACAGFTQTFDPTPWGK